MEVPQASSLITGTNIVTAAVGTAETLVVKPHIWILRNWISLGMDVLVMTTLEKFSDFLV